MSQREKNWNQKFLQEATSLWTETPQSTTPVHHGNRHFRIRFLGLKADCSKGKFSSANHYWTVLQIYGIYMASWNVLVVKASDQSLVKRTEKELAWLFHKQSEFDNRRPELLFFAPSLHEDSNLLQGLSKSTLAMPQIAKFPCSAWFSWSKGPMAIAPRHPTRQLPASSPTWMWQHEFLAHSQLETALHCLRSIDRRKG